MRVMVVGAGKLGARTVTQLKKNERIEIVMVDPRDEPYALRHGIVDSIEIREALTPLNLDYVIDLGKPDLILLTTDKTDMGLGKAAGMDLLVESLRAELTALSPVPIVEVSRSRS